MIEYKRMTIYGKEVNDLGAVVELKNITKRFPGIVANRDISLEIQEGEIFALLGENGAGKSVLMSILFGMYEPDGGEVWIKGEKVEAFSPQKSTERGIGMVHQHFKLVENYTVAENITLGMEPIKKFGPLAMLDRKQAIESVAELSKKYGLDVSPEQRIDTLNVAGRQRVEILKMLYRNADILIFDEPTAVLTPQEIAYLLEILRELKASGKTIILVTHKLEEIKQVADRFAVLNRGKLVAVREVKDTTTKEMANLMVGRDVVLETEKTPAKFGEVVFEAKHLAVKNLLGLEKIRNMSFSIRAGEIFAVAGVDGNGQDELVSAIAGMTKLSGGQIFLNGKDIGALSVRERNLAGLSYIPEDRQNVGLIIDFDISENLALRKYYKPEYNVRGGMDKEAFRKIAEEWTEKYDIRSGSGISTTVRAMSGGNQQKLIIAREVEEDLPFIMIVQPTRGLDIGAIENTRNVILEQREKGKAILLISLELDEVIALADTIGVLYNGEFTRIAGASELTTEEIGEYMMGVRQ